MVISSSCFQILTSFVSALYFKIWKQKLVQMGAVIEERLSKRVTHIFAIDSDTLLRQFDNDRLSRFKGVAYFSQVITFLIFCLQRMCYPTILI